MRFAFSEGFAEPRFEGRVDVSVIVGGMPKRPPVEERTVLEQFAWTYATMTMVYASRRHGGDAYTQTGFIVRNKNYHGILRGTLNLGALLVDERSKHRHIDRCSYCFAGDAHTIDHLIPQLRGGTHDAYNILVSCRSCNSSKGARDFLIWSTARDHYPPIRPLRRYLKLMYHCCNELGILDVPLVEAPELSDDFPFSIASLPDHEPDLKKIVRELDA